MTDIASYTPTIYGLIHKEDIFDEPTKKSGKPVNSIWVNLFIEDKLSFMDSFDFPPLPELKSSLLKSKVASTEKINEFIAGLETLPEYKNNS